MKNADLIDRERLLKYIDNMSIEDTSNNLVFKTANTILSMFKQVVEAMPRQGEMITIADFIDREELKLQIAKQSRYFGFGFINKIIAIINEQPSADTERHAHWIKTYNEITNEHIFECSNCRCEIDNVDNVKYCSNCGYKMIERGNIWNQ